MAKKSKIKQTKSRKSAMGTAASRAKERNSPAYKRKIAKLKKEFPEAFDARKGNNFWERRAKHGRDAIFASPQIMQEAMMDYFRDNAENPYWFKKEWKTVNGKLKLVQIPMETPLTWEGLCIYLGVSVSYFTTFKSTLKQDDPDRKDFLWVISWAGDVIFKQKLDGTSVGAYNAQLMSYHLGIRRDMPQGSAAGVVINVNKDDNKQLLDDVMNKLNELDKE